MKLRNKIILLKILYNVLSCAILGFILFIAYLNYKFIETVITIILFYVYRRLFEKQYHADTMTMCALVSVIVFSVIIHLEVALSISILYSIVLTFIVTLISYYVKDYFDKKAKLSSLNNKRLENLTRDEFYEIFKSFDLKTVNIVYDYIHRNDLTVYDIAYKYDVSESSIYKYLKRIRHYYKTLNN